MERCEECAHYKVCKEVNDLKCRDQIIWYDAKSGCPYYSADVVPRSDVDWYKLAELNAQRIIELEAEKDNLIKNYAVCMREYAREIFEEIEDRLLPSNMSGEFRGDSVEWFDYFDLHLAEDIAELKNKYTEGRK